MNVLAEMLRQARGLIHANDRPPVGPSCCLRGCREIAETDGPTIRMCSLSKGHEGDHVASRRPVRGARV